MKPPGLHVHAHFDLHRTARGSLAVVDQGLISATHFLLGVSVARGGSGAALGLFGIVFLSLNAAGDFHRAIVWLPMSQQPRTEHFAIARALSIRWAALGSVAGFILAFALWTAGEIDWTIVTVLASLILPVFFVNEVQRRIQYARSRPALAVVSSCAYLMAACTVLAVGTPATSQEAVVGALLALLAASAVGSLVGWLMLRRLPTSAVSIQELARHYAPSAAPYVVSSMMQFGSQRFTLFVVAGMLGLEAMGSVEAGRLLTAPWNVVVLGVASVSVPAIGTAVQEGGRRLGRGAVMRLNFPVGIAAVTYGVVLAFLFRPLSLLALGRVYPFSLSIALVFTAVGALALVSTGFVTLLGAMGRAAAVPRARAPGLILVLLAVIPLASLWGVRAVVALMLCESILSLILLGRASIERNRA